MIPSFRHMGGKARLRSWLIAHFPCNIKTYVEPFAGKGNVFYAVKSLGRASDYILSDIDTSFLRCLINVDLKKLPESVSKESFKYWKANQTDIAKVLEPRITFGGKGYEHGYSGSSGPHVGYSKVSYTVMCEAARNLLNGVKITSNCPWQILLRAYTTDWFVYLDPPYNGTKASYNNIEHVELIKHLNSMDCRWAISGYSSPLYEMQLKFIDRFERVRNSEIKSSNSGRFEASTEILWTNYKRER